MVAHRDDGLRFAVDGKRVAPARAVDLAASKFGPPTRRKMNDISAIGPRTTSAIHKQYRQYDEA